jgi:hypothetical protein
VLHEAVDRMLGQREAEAIAATLHLAGFTVPGAATFGATNAAAKMIEPCDER